MDDFALIRTKLIKLMGFMCDEFHLRQTSVLRLLVPSEIREGKVKELFEKYAVLGDYDLQSLSRAKKAATKSSKNCKTEQRMLISDIKQQFGESAVKAHIDKNFIVVEKQKINRTPLWLGRDDKTVTLNAQQLNAIETIQGNKTFLLHGVTGSGKNRGLHAPDFART